MDRPVITKANFDTLAGKIEDYNSFNDSLTLAEIQHRAKELFDKEIPLEILQGENHHQEFRGWLMREVNPVIEFDNGKKKEIVKNPQPDNELGEFIFREAKPVIQKKFDFENVPEDGVGFETDKGIFTYDGNLDNFYNNKTGEAAEQSLDMALNFAAHYGDVKDAVQAIDYGYDADDIKKLYRRYPILIKEVIEEIDNHLEIIADKVKEFLQNNAKNWTLVFDVDNDGKNILRGADAEKAIQKKITQHKEYWARKKAVSTVDLNAKPKTNAEKLQQCIAKAIKNYLTSELVVPNPEAYTTAEGVKQFLLSSPNVKLEQMTKLIDAVAPMAAFNSEKEIQFSERVKYKIQQDKKFQAKLAANKKSVQKGR